MEEIGGMVNVEGNSHKQPGKVAILSPTTFKGKNAIDLVSVSRLKCECLMRS